MASRIEISTSSSNSSSLNVSRISSGAISSDSPSSGVLTCRSVCAGSSGRHQHREQKNHRSCHGESNIPVHVYERTRPGRCSHHQPMGSAQRARKGAANAVMST